MSHPIPEDAQRLAHRLRTLADEIESAARYGVPIPHMVNVSGHRYSGASFAATAEQFARWAEYVEAEPVEDVHHDARWLSIDTTIAEHAGGLPLSFATSTPLVAEVAS